jgi:hypothetical protein
MISNKSLNSYFRIVVYFLLRMLLLYVCSFLGFLPFQFVQLLPLVKCRKTIFQYLFRRCTVFRKLPNQRRNDIVSNSWIFIWGMKRIPWTLWHLSKLTIQMPINVILSRANSYSKSFAEINAIRSKHQR